MNLTTLREGDNLHAELIAEWLLRGDRRKLLVIMGLPASGKSTLCERLEARGSIRVNRDDIRKRLYGDAGQLGDPKQVNREYYNELRAAFAKGGPVISDNVNLTIFHRRGTLEEAAKAGYTDITIVWVDVPLDVALERNRKRDRKVPEDAIRDMHGALVKEGGPGESEGHLVKLQNGSDMGHYRIAQVRMRPAPAAPTAPAPTAPAKEPEVNNVNQPTNPSAEDKRRQLVTDLRLQVNLLDACVAAGRHPWAAETLGVIRTLSDGGVALFGDTPTTGGGTTTKPPARPKLPPPTPEQINEVLLKMIGEMPVVGWTGPLVTLCFNGHLLTKEKAEEMVLPLSELIKRAHIVFFQETNVDALRVLGKAVRYGVMASHRNKREQACGFLVHPRLQWIGSAPVYHDYLLEVPNHPEYKETMRPAIQRRMRDRVTGFVFDVINFHGKSNLGGPDATRPIRLWQFDALMKKLAEQKTTSPYQPRDNAKPAPAPTTDGTAKLLPDDDSAWSSPLGAVILGADYNCPIEKPETTETAPLTAAGFQRISTEDLRWTYQYRGNGGQFDGFYVREVDGMVVKCFIPPFSTNKREAFFYSRISDHMPVFMVLQPPVPVAATVAAEESTTPAAAPAPADAVVTASAA
jgi:predicted kinase